jgi:flagellar FliJ protein
MSSTSALDTLVEMTKELLDDASIRLANSRKSAKQAKEFMDTLLSYRTDYTKEMQRLMRNGMSAMTLGHYQAFVSSLDNAIGQASTTLKGLEKSVDAEQSNWLDKHQKINAYETLIDRRLKTAAVKESRQEQRETDEISAQLRVRQARNALSSPGF